MSTPSGPASGPSDREIDAVCLRFENGWRGGLPEPLERFVSSAPESARQELFRRLLAIEAEYRKRAGTPLTPETAHAHFGLLGAWVAGVIEDVLEPRGAVVLEALSGPYAGISFPLTGHTTCTVGRREGVNIRLPDDPHVSRVHCLFEVNLPFVRVGDLQSSHGTWVNEARIERADLRDGDHVRVGGTTLRVRIPGDGPATATSGDGTQAYSGCAPGVRSVPVVPHYRVEEELGHGAMGVVYRGVRLSDGLTVALKTLCPAVAPTPESLGRFKRESAILARLDHPSVVKFLDVGAAAELLYFVMEYVPGVNGAEVVKASGPLPPERVLGWTAQVIDGLSHAHERGFVHRDVKPSNLLVSGAPGSEQVKVSDFGLARAYETSSFSGLTLANAVGGTLDFMAPEQAGDFRNVRPAADQYALAATLFYLLTGQPVYERSGSQMECLGRILRADPLPLRPGAAALPAPFGSVIRRGLARHPSARYPDLKAMKAELFAS